MPAFPKLNPTETDPVASPAVSAEATARAAAVAAEASTRAAADALLIPATEKAVANGVATLGSDGKILDAQLGQLAITDVFPVASQAAMLALTAERGDVAIRSDVNKSFILSASPASTLANWKELLTPTDVVTTVNGRQGTVTGLAEQSALDTEVTRATAAEASAVVLAGTKAAKASNLSDLTDASAARTNLGLGTAATTAASAYATAAQGTDARAPLTGAQILAGVAARLPVVYTPAQMTRYLHLRADDISGADGDLVATWADLSGNGRDAVQATAGAKPTLKTGQLNGRKCVRFASGKFMLTTGLSQAVPYTVFVVMHMPRNPTGSAAYRFAWNNGNGGGINSANNGSVRVNNATTPMGDGWTAVFSLEYISGSTMVRRNGVPICRVASAQTMTATVLGTDDDGAQTFTNFDGDIYELLVVASQLTDYKRAGVEQALCAYYGLPWTPAAVSDGAALTSVSVNSTNCSIWTPPDFDKYRPTPLLLVSHGNSQSETVLTNEDFCRIVDVALQMGFVVAASAEHGTGQATFAGTTQGLADDLALYNYVVANIAPTISKTVTCGISYGGINSALNMSRITNVVGRLGIAPVCDTTVAPTTSNAVSNPMTDPTSNYANKRFLSFASSGDTTVSKTNHSDAFHTRINSVARESSVVAVSGNHIDETHFQPMQTAQFLARCLADA